MRLLGKSGDEGVGRSIVLEPYMVEVKGSGYDYYVIAYINDNKIYYIRHLDGTYLTQLQANTLVDKIHNNGGYLNLENEYMRIFCNIA